MKLSSYIVKHIDFHTKTANLLWNDNFKLMQVDLKLIRYIHSVLLNLVNRWIDSLLLKSCDFIFVWHVYLLLHWNRELIHLVRRLNHLLFLLKYLARPILILITILLEVDKLHITFPLLVSLALLQLNRLELLRKIQMIFFYIANKEQQPRCILILK